jgi:hypothetical protein
MENYTAYISDPEPRPETPYDDEGGSPPVTQRRWEPAVALARIISLLSDTRRLILVTGALLAASVVAVGIVSSVLLGRGIGFSLGSVGLLLPVLLTWMVSAVLLVQTESPVADVLGEVRRVTGAPVEPSAPWRSLGVRPMGEPDAEWDPVQFIGIVNFQHSRARLALFWAVIATAGCLAWTVFMLAVAAVS